MNLYSVLLAMSLLVPIAGCAQNGNADSTKPVSSPEQFYGTYLFVQSCQTKLEKPSGVLGSGGEFAASLASGVVKTGIDWIGAALQRAAQDDVEKTTVSANLISVSQVADSTDDICLQIVRGQFKFADSSQNKNTYTNNFAVDLNRRELALLEVVKGSEELFVEILPLVHENVVSFVPLEVRYSGYTPSDRSGRKPRDLALFIGFSLADKDISAGEFSGRLINLGTLTPDGKKPATIKYVNNGKLSLVNQTQWLSLPDIANDQPMTFAATVIETRKASQFAKFLAAAFESSKDDIKSKAEAAVTELEIFKTSKDLKKEQIETEKERLANEQNYFNEIVTARTKEDALSVLCKSTPAPPENRIYAAQKDLYFAKKNANIAAAFAGISRPYNDSDIKSPTGTCED